MNDPFAAIKAARRPGRWLRFAADRWSLAYLAGATALTIAHWQAERIHPALVALACAMAYGCGCIQHDHAHLPLWRPRGLNLLTSLWLAALRGDGPWTWLPTHIANHHRHANRRGDLTLTWRTGVGNHVGNLALYAGIGLALYVVAALRFFAATMARDRRLGLAIAAQVAVPIALHAWGWRHDASRALWLIALPQVFGIVAMVATGYMQHHHADERSAWAHSRDFTGWSNNRLHFNHGYHSVHHVDRALHWSEWPAAHALIARRLDHRLIEPSLPWYLARTFILAPVLPALRGDDLRAIRIAGGRS